jgi:hypothetical protein
VAQKARAVPAPHPRKKATQTRVIVTATTGLRPNPTTATTTKGPSTAAEVVVRRTVVYDGKHLRQPLCLRIMTWSLMMRTTHRILDRQEETAIAAAASTSSSNNNNASSFTFQETMALEELQGKNLELQRQLLLLQREQK